MPWFLLEVAKIEKRTSKRLFGLTRANLSSYHDLDIQTYGKGMDTKPTEIPEGFTLKYFPESHEINEKRDERMRLPILHPAVWALPPWTTDDPPPWGHMSVLRMLYMPLLTANGLINFYPSYTHMKEDRTETVSIGRFLKTMWQQMDAGWNDVMTRDYGELTDEVIRQWSQIPKAQTPDDVKLAITPDEIESVYLRGPSSCMAHETEKFHTRGIHPVRAYGAGDLALAWLPKSRNPEQASQRALVWPAKKLYSRIYGTGPLEAFLQTLGYVQGTFHGAKLLKIPVPGSTNLVVPYVDWHDYVVERKSCLRIFHKHKPHPLAPTVEITVTPRTPFGVWSAQGSTAGIAPQPRKCRNCETRLTPKEMSDGQNACDKCYRTKATCSACNKMHSKKKYNWVILATEDLLQYKHTYELIAEDPSARFCVECATEGVLAEYRRSGYHLVHRRAVTV